MSQTSSEKKSVVIVGGGFAGSALARTLSSKLDPDRHTLTLINSRPFMIHIPSTIRLAVSSDHDIGDKSFMPYDHLFSKVGSLMVGTVATIETNPNGGGHVVLEDGKKVKFDLLALSTGSKLQEVVSFPNTAEEVKKVLQLRREKFAAAKEIVLVGGGAVGVEMAGEIKDAYPTTKLTIVHAEPQLFNPAYPHKFRNAIERSLRARGVSLLLNEYVDAIPKDAKEVKTRSGKTLNGDLIISTRGPKPNADFLSSLGNDTLTKAGRVKVKPTLQLVSHQDIFALGDVIDVEEQKQAAKVPSHAGVVAANILSILDGKEAKAVYKGSPELIVVTNGKNGGVSYFGFLWGLLFGDWVSRLLKSKNLMVPWARSAMGLPN